MSPGDQARRDQVLEGIGRERVEGVDLLGDAHRADFGGHGRADPAGDHQAGQHGAEFAGDRDDHHVRDCALRREPGKPGVALQRQHHAGEDRRQADHGERVVADVDHLPADQARVDRRAHAVTERERREHAEPASGGEKSEERPTKGLQNGHPLAYRSR